MQNLQDYDLVPQPKELINSCFLDELYIFTDAVYIIPDTVTTIGNVSVKIQ